MDDLYSKTRADRFQRILITFFFSETLSDKERKMVIWIVRFVTVVAALIFAMFITLVTESILSFLWFIVIFVAWYVMLIISGLLKKILRKKHHVH